MNHTRLLSFILKDFLFLRKDFTSWPRLASQLAAVLRPQPPECRDDGCLPPCPAEGSLIRGPIIIASNMYVCVEKGRLISVEQKQQEINYSGEMLAVCAKMVAIKIEIYDGLGGYL